MYQQPPRQPSGSSDTHRTVRTVGTLYQPPTFGAPTFGAPAKTTIPVYGQGYTPTAYAQGRAPTTDTTSAPRPYRPTRPPILPTSNTFAPRPQRRGLPDLTTLDRLDRERMQRASSHPVWVIPASPTMLLCAVAATLMSLLTVAAAVAASAGRIPAQWLLSAALAGALCTLPVVTGLLIARGKRVRVLF